MSEPNKIKANQEWIEEDLCKMSYKELKKIAIQRNINAKLKKAQLLNALLNATDVSEETVCDKTKYTDVHVMGRVTRSRASTSRPFNNTNNDKSTSMKIDRLSMSGEKQINKKGRKKAMNESRENINSSETNNSEKPLIEITNNTKLLDVEYNYRDSVYNKTDSLLDSKQSSRENRRTVNKTSTGKEVKGSKVMPHSSVKNQCKDGGATQDLNILRSTANNEEVTRKRRGRKKKTPQEPNKNLAIPTVIVDCFEDQINIDKMLEEETVNEESHNDQGKTTGTPISEFENNKEITDKIQDCSDITIKQTDAEGTQCTELKRSNTFTVSDEVAEPKGTQCSELKRSNTFTVSDEDAEPKKTQCSELKRSNTFTVSEEDAEFKATQCSELKRSNTFTVSDEDETAPRQLRFTSVTDVGDKSISKTAFKEKKSIGERILSSSKKIGGIASTGKKNVKGVSVKKTITKNNNTSGSLFKSNSGVVRKAPNFKAIHKKLFDNMESLNDNNKRKLARAESLLQSPVPRCAVLSPSFKLLKKEPKTNPILKTGIPVKIRTPNSLGCNTKHVDRNVAKSTIGMKMPPINIEKQKEKDRAYIQGVRMNKRFLLQMEMRLKNQ